MNNFISNLRLNSISLYAGGADELWFRALTRFELVFSELEDALDNVEDLEAFDIPGIRIKHHISEDLDNYYGKDRKTDSAAGKMWISTVRKLRDEDPRLIAAYIYHMYLGLYSGGKILRHKFKLPGQTLDLDERSNNVKSSLKTAMKNLVLSDAALAQKLIEHSENLFKLNNLIIKECEIQKTRLFKIFGIIAFSITGICIYKSVSN